MDTPAPVSGELRGLDPEGKLEVTGVVLIKERGCIGKLGTVRDALDPPSGLA